MSKNKKNWRKEIACNYVKVDFTFQDFDFALSILEFVQQSELTAAWETKCLDEAQKFIRSVSLNLQCFGEFNYKRECYIHVHEISINDVRKSGKNHKRTTKTTHNYITH